MPEWIDVNVSVGQWPFRRVHGDAPSDLVEILRSGGVTQAWAGSLEGLFQRDVAGVNDRLARTCREQGGGMLVPFGTVNPALPDWEEDLRRCHEVHKMPGIRLHPNYQGYQLDDPNFAELLIQSSRRELIVQLVASMEDERTQHPQFRVPHVDFRMLEGLLPRIGRLKLVLLNAFRANRVGMVANLARLGRVCVDIAMLEGSGAVRPLLDALPAGRVLFGSHAPLFVWSASEGKLRESGLSPREGTSIRGVSARSLLDPQ